MNGHPVSILAHFCQASRLEQPNYQYMHHDAADTFSCTVMVPGLGTFKTMEDPEADGVEAYSGGYAGGGQYRSKRQAKEAAARFACRSLPLDPQKQRECLCQRAPQLLWNENLRTGKAELSVYRQALTQLCDFYHWGPADFTFRMRQAPGSSSMNHFCTVSINNGRYIYVSPQGYPTKQAGKNEVSKKAVLDHIQQIQCQCGAFEWKNLPGYGTHASASEGGNRGASGADGFAGSGGNRHNYNDVGGGFNRNYDDIGRTGFAGSDAISDILPTHIKTEEMDAMDSSEDNYIPLSHSDEEMRQFWLGTLENFDHLHFPQDAKQWLKNVLQPTYSSHNDQFNSNQPEPMNRRDVGNHPGSSAGYTASYSSQSLFNPNPTPVPPPPPPSPPLPLSSNPAGIVFSYREVDEDKFQVRAQVSGYTVASVIAPSMEEGQAMAVAAIKQLAENSHGTWIPIKPKVSPDTESEPECSRT